MKYGFAFLIALLTGTAAMAQDIPDISGNWYSVLSMQGHKLRLNISLDRTSDTSYTGTFFSPDQVKQGFPINHASLHGDTLAFAVPMVGGSFRGIWDFRASAYIGSFKQAGLSLPLGFSRVETTEADIKHNRPQTPKPPFNYLSQEILVPNDSAKVTLAGTFTRPNRNKRYTTVILITGSGPQDRDETLFDHKPFWIIADQLAKEGIATLRLDDRGVGASTGSYNTATISDFASDVRAAMAYLRTRPDVDVQHIGLLGHSEGAQVMQVVAADNPYVAFCVSLSGPGVPGADLMLKQNELVYRSMNATPGQIKTRLDYMKNILGIMSTEMDKTALSKKLTEEVKSEYAALPDSVKAGVPEAQYVFSNVAGFTRPELLSIVRFNPADYLPRIHCPFLAINGSRDIQVDATQNLNGIDALLRQGGNNRITIRKFEGLNHLLQECQECTVAEYETLEQSISPNVVDFISNWLTLLPTLQSK